MARRKDAIYTRQITMPHSIVDMKPCAMQDDNYSRPPPYSFNCCIHFCFLHTACEAAKECRTEYLRTVLNLPGGPLPPMLDMILPASSTASQLRFFLNRCSILDFMSSEMTTFSTLAISLIREVTFVSPLEMYCITPVNPMPCTDLCPSPSPTRPAQIFFGFRNKTCIADSKLLMIKSARTDIHGQISVDAGLNPSKRCHAASTMIKS